ncbi:predicted protein [Nematostella vectensis]|uniref:Uncharacterized protein n=1 Tax=Nematostella vectensis TaxID=45351 RepID=A7SRJ8_NEMVE|nr:predicted protein [Nematostella vectensis]|eukprot:XP_001625773.1 predicted protein [Nematostella vectensis]
MLSGFATSGAKWDWAQAHRTEAPPLPLYSHSPPRLTTTKEPIRCGRIRHVVTQCPIGLCALS